MKEKICVLLSGGIDSTGLIYLYSKLNFKIYPLIINYGQKAFKSEKKSSIYVCEYFKTKYPQIINLKNISTKLNNPLITGNQKKSLSYRRKSSSEYFPFRNLFLLTTASIYAKNNNIGRVAIGIIDSGANSYADTTNIFLKKTSILFKQTENLFLDAPFIKKNKSYIINLLKNSGINITNTYSCNIQSDKPCLKCASCIERESSM